MRNEEFFGGRGWGRRAGKRTAFAFRAAVGRDAISARPAAARTPRADKSAPTNKVRGCGGAREGMGAAAAGRKPRGGKRRGRCHRPGNPAAAQTPAGGINPAPTNNFYVWANRGGRAVKTNGCRFPGGRRAGCPHPAAPRGNINARGRIWPAPTNRGGRLTNRETANPRGVANFCRGRCLHRPGNPAVTQTPAGGYGIRPYDRRNRGQTGNRGAAQTSVGDDACIVPGTLWQRKHLRAG